MQQEVEAKFLRQNHEVIRAGLKAIGAKCEAPKRLIRRTVFDYPDRRLQAERAWIRLREELDGSTELVLKKVTSDEIGHTFELPVGVTDYKAAKQFLLAIGLVVKGEQESKREVWRYQNTEIMLDEWPWVPSFIEIEAPTEAEVQDLARKLNLKWKDARFGGVTPVYTEAYSLSAQEFEALEISMQFGSPVPRELTKQ